MIYHIISKNYKSKCWTCDPSPFNTVRTVHDTRSNLPDQPYMRRNVNSTNAQSPTCFDTREVNCDSLCSRHPEDGTAVPKQLGIIS